MNKLAFALIASTALVVTAFAPDRFDRNMACGVFFAFAFLTVAIPTRKHTPYPDETRQKR